MKNKRILSLLLVGLLGVSSNMVYADVISDTHYEVTENMDGYTYTSIGNGVSNHYFNATSQWEKEDGQVCIYGQIYTKSQDPWDDNFYFVEDQEKTGIERCRMSQDDFGWASTASVEKVRFSHYASEDYFIVTTREVYCP